jgi:hypothetical protein
MQHTTKSEAPQLLRIFEIFGMFDTEQPNDAASAERQTAHAERADGSDASVCCGDDETIVPRCGPPQARDEVLS